MSYQLTTKEANSIPLATLLSKLGFHSEDYRKGGTELWYCSPLRPNERTPSFKVSLEKNTWFDFAMRTGEKKGTVLGFIQEYKKCSIGDAFRFLAQLNNKEFLPDIKENINAGKKRKRVKSRVDIRSIKNIQNTAFVKYLESRKINVEIANSYLIEVYYRRSSMNYFGIGMENDSKGYEIRDLRGNKWVIGKKDITTVKKGYNKVSVFEGFIDFLSLLSMENITELKSDVIILHSTTNVTKALNRILKSDYTKAYLFFDNDLTGDRATNEVKSGLEFEVKDMRYLYKDWNDINDFLVHGPISSITKNKKTAPASNV